MLLQRETPPPTSRCLASLQVARAHVGLINKRTSAKVRHLRILLEKCEWGQTPLNNTATEWNLAKREHTCVTATTYLIFSIYKHSSAGTVGAKINCAPRKRLIFQQKKKTHMLASANRHFFDTYVKRRSKRWKWATCTLAHALPGRA